MFTEQIFKTTGRLPMSLNQLEECFTLMIELANMVDHCDSNVIVKVTYQFIKIVYRLVWFFDFGCFQFTISGTM